MPSFLARHQLPSPFKAVIIAEYFTLLTFFEIGNRPEQKNERSLVLTPTTSRLMEVKYMKVQKGEVKRLNRREAGTRDLGEPLKAQD